MIIIKDLSLSYGEQVIFDRINLHIQETDRIGLVGNNGAGKSTLLGLISKKPLPAGISVIGKKRIGYISQHVTLNSPVMVSEEIIADLELIDETERERKRAQGKQILSGLGFAQEKLEMPVSALSGGWKMRLVLGKLLLSEPDFYLFDEPTNHLDIVAKEWFSNFLVNCPVGFMLVSHDRYFLDHHCTTIIELERGHASRYNGNYSSYLMQKEESLARLEAAYIQQQKEIERKQATIERFRASASKAPMAKSMEKQLNRIERIELPPALPKVSISFPKPPTVSRQVLQVNKVSFGYDDKPLFANVSFLIERGQKVAIIAANGVGKTTLFNLLMGKLQPKTGIFNWAHDAQKAYFEQDQGLALNPNQTIEESVYERVPLSVTSTTIRTMLGCFLFSGDTVQKSIKVLSGGEKNRVAMAAVLLQSANVLLLDEPTNHLDMQSKDRLLDALRAYPGTMLFVSHDQDFINRLATHILELTPQGAYLYTGNYDDFLFARAAALKPTTQPIKQDGSLSNAEVKNSASDDRLKEVERLMANADKEIAKLQRALEEFSPDSHEYKQRLKRLEKFQAEHEQLFREWESLMNKQ